jgi:hypothetical protein
MRGVVHTPYYDWDGRKYLEILIEGRVTRVKVPFRYGRVMCRVFGRVMKLKLKLKRRSGTESTTGSL